MPRPPRPTPPPLPPPPPRIEPLERWQERRVDIYHRRKSLQKYGRQYPHVSRPHHEIHVVPRHPLRQLRVELLARLEVPRVHEPDRHPPPPPPLARARLP